MSCGPTDRGSGVVSVSEHSACRESVQLPLTTSIREGVLRLILLVTMLLTTVAGAADGFRRGVNISHWYAQSLVGHYRPEHVDHYFTAEDADLIAAAGFDHVRLTIDASVAFEDGPTRDTLIERVALFPRVGLNVIVDLHPSDDYKASLNEPAAADAFVADWRALADELKHHDPATLWFEVMNEPNEAKQWRAVQQRAVKAVREVAPDHTIVVTAGGWSNASTLYGDPDDENNEPTQPFVPYEIDNLVYTFHFYEPFMFTHQAAEWGWAPAARTSGLGWPLASDTTDADAVADATTTDAEARGHVRYQVANGYYTKSWIKKKFDGVAAWQAEHEVPVYLGEFGVYTKAAPREARLAWHSFVSAQAASHGWGWAVWDYSGGFGVFPGEPGERSRDAGLLRALGLQDAESVLED